MIASASQPPPSTIRQASASIIGNPRMSPMDERSKMWPWTRRIPRGGPGRASHGVPRLAARCSGPLWGPPPARVRQSLPMGRDRRTRALAARGRNAPHGSPSTPTPLTPPASHERLHSMASRRRHHSAVSRDAGSRYTSVRRLKEIAFTAAALTSPWFIGRTFPTPTVMRDVGTWP